MREGEEEPTEQRDLALIDALGLGVSPGIVSVVGGGGKSSLLFALAEALPGRTVLTTTTRIFASQTRLAGSVCTLDDPNWERALSSSRGGALVVGEIEDRHALGVPVHIPAQILARSDVDSVIVEADGSRRLPVKAPADHEPVVPAETDTLVTVAGLDALSAPIGQIAHRPERVCAVTGMDEQSTLSPDALGRLLASERGGAKGAPPGARKVILINKVESDEGFALAQEVARSALAEASLERVVAGALRTGPNSGWSAWLR
jgi:molybdenum cofactor cytidylyltransferase